MCGGPGANAGDGRGGQVFALMPVYDAVNRMFARYQLLQPQQQITTTHTWPGRQHARIFCFTVLGCVEIQPAVS